MRTLYIIKTGCTFPAIAEKIGDFDTWIAAGLTSQDPLASKLPSIAVIDAFDNDTGSLAFPDPDTCAGVVISGSHDMVTDNAPWMQALGLWLQQVCYAGVPVLGICFGHQILAHVLGGQVGMHPDGLEIGTVPITVQADVSQDPLWRHMPACFEAQVVHYQSVRSLPPGACLIAGNLHEQHQAFRWRDNVWGVQFHPEFSQAAMQGYIDHVVQALQQRGNPCLPSHNLRCEPTSAAAQLLDYFALHARQYATLGAHHTIAPCKLVPGSTVT